jgi:glucose uptake protein GlcU
VAILAVAVTAVVAVMLVAAVMVVVMVIVLVIVVNDSDDDNRKNDGNDKCNTAIFINSYFKLSYIIYSTLLQLISMKSDLSHLHKVCSITCLTRSV